MEQENTELKSKLERAAKRTGQPSEKSRSATPNIIFQNKDKQGEPRAQHGFNITDASLILGEPILPVSESEAASRWLYTHVEEDSDSKIAEVMLWDTYTSHAKSLSAAPAPLLSRKDLISLVVRVFANARVLTTNDSARIRYIKGIRFRHTRVDFQRLEGLVREKDRAYATLVEKHFKLLRKSHELKESVKSWQAYYDRIVSMPHLQRRSVDNVTLAGIDNEQGAKNTSPGAITGAFDHDFIQQTIKEHGAGSGTPTSRNDYPSKDYTNHLVDPVGVTASSDLNGRLLLPQQNVDLTTDSSCTSNACASDDSTQLASSSPMYDKKTTVAGIHTVAPVAIGDGSDSPTVVAERSLKRKRQKIVQHRKFHVHEDTCGQIGSSGKPICVKIEPGSSPEARITTLVLDPVHDTLDLDEVGDGGLTPRKRMKLQEILGSDEAHNSTAQQPFSLKLTEDIENGYTDLNTSTDDLNIVQHQEVNDDLRASCTRLGDEYGRRLFQQHLDRKTESVRERENVDCHTPTQLLAPQQTRIAKQHLHNYKVNSRQNHSLTGSHSIATRSEAKTASSKGAPVPRTSYSETKDILQPLTPNMQILPRTSIQACISKFSPVQKRCSNTSAQILLLSEDGECDSRYQSDFTTAAKQSNGSIAGNTIKASTMTAIHHRLRGLLSEPSPEKPTLAQNDIIPRPGRSAEDPDPIRETFTVETSRARSPVISAEEGAPPIPIIDLEAEKPREAVSSSRTRPVTDVGTIHGSTRAGRPLRSRPVRSLRLDDFKLNPAVNSGVDFAFNQVIRNKDQRRCLPNCTKPECCGDKFDKIVRIGGVPAPPARGLWDSSQMDDADQDHRLLRDFTGLDVEALDSMPRAEKDLLLERAKAHKLGSEYGRHRHAHERPASPPGFWRTEMPTTQEVEGDKAKALVVERQKIEGRYREALKGSGKWIFRDE